LSKAKYQRPVCRLTGQYRWGLVFGKASDNEGNRRVAVRIGKPKATAVIVDFGRNIDITQQGRLVANITVFFYGRTCMAECAEFSVMAVMQP
jgi:hypothetical protein